MANRTGTTQRVRDPRRGGTQVLQEVGAGRGDRAELRLRRRAGGADADHRRHPPGPRAHRLRRQLLGQPRRPLLRLPALPARLHHRDAAKRRHLRRREEALPRHPRAGGALPRGEGDLRLRHLRHRHDRRRHRGGLPRRRGRRSPCRSSRSTRPASSATRTSATGSPARSCSSTSSAPRSRRCTTPYDMNLIGEYNIAGDLWGMLPLFERLGHPGPLLHQRRRASSRSCATPTGPAQRHHLLEEPHQPRPEDEEALRHPVPRGVVLRDDRHRQGAARHRARAGPSANGRRSRTMQDRVERLVDEEEARCRDRLAPYRARLAGKRAVLFTGGVKTWSMVNALRELGVEILAAGTQNSTLEDFYRMKALMHQDARIIEDTSHRRAPRRHVREAARPHRRGRQDQVPRAEDADARSSTSTTAAPTPTPGYEGMVTFARQLDLTVNNPIWPVAQRRARPGSWTPARAGGRAPPPPATPRPSSPRTSRVSRVKVSREGRDGEPAEELAGARRDARLPRGRRDARRSSTARRAARPSSGCSSPGTSRSRSRSTRPP